MFLIRAWQIDINTIFEELTAFFFFFLFYALFFTFFRVSKNIGLTFFSNQTKKTVQNTMQVEI